MTSGWLRTTANSSGRPRFETWWLAQPESRRAAADAAKVTFTIRISDFLPRGLPFTGQQRPDQQQQHADGNGNVAEIEDQKGTIASEMNVGIVDDIAEPHPIENIAERAAKDEAERDRVVAPPLPPEPGEDEDRDCGGQADEQP